MILDEKLRWAGFWILDGLRGGQTRQNIMTESVMHGKKEALLQRQKKEFRI